MMPKGGKPFSKELAEAKFELQEGVCAACGEPLYKNSRTKGKPRAWHAHHIQNLTIDQSIENCAVVCINGDDGGCHIAFAHLGNTQGPTMPKEEFKFLWSERARRWKSKRAKDFQLGVKAHLGDESGTVVWVEPPYLYVLVDPEE